MGPALVQLVDILVTDEGLEQGLGVDAVEPVVGVIDVVSCVVIEALAGLNGHGNRIHLSHRHGLTAIAVGRGQGGQL